MMPDELAPLERKLFVIIQERLDWVSRAELATKLDILELSAIHKKLLQQLEQKGFIERRRRRTTIGSAAHDYRVKA